MNKIIFIKDIKSYSPKNAFIARLTQEILTEDDLFNELNKQLFFPDYFGFNWNALSDCLNDFRWIEQEEIILIHYQNLLLDDLIMNIYLEVLLDAIEKWEERKDHYFEVVFPMDLEVKINHYLENIL